VVNEQFEVWAQENGEQRSSMAKTTLSPEQAAIVTGTVEPVRICMPDGSIAGWLKRNITPQEPIFTPEEIAEAERRANAPGPWYTTQEVLARLRSLE
jgi:hypothetical protein